MECVIMGQSEMLGIGQINKVKVCLVSFFLLRSNRKIKVLKDAAILSRP
jgi:hypothetical protein